MKKHTIVKQRWLGALKRKLFVLPLVAAIFACAGCRQAKAQAELSPTERSSSGREFFPMWPKGHEFEYMSVTVEGVTLKPLVAFTFVIDGSQIVKGKQYTQITATCNQCSNHAILGTSTRFTRQAEDGLYGLGNRETDKESLMVPFPVILGTDWTSLDALDGTPMVSNAKAIVPLDTLNAHWPRCLKIVGHSADGNRSFIEYYAEGVGKVWAMYDRNINYKMSRTFAVRMSDPEPYLRPANEPSAKELEHGFGELGIGLSAFYEITNTFKKEKGGETYFVYDIHVWLLQKNQDVNVLVGFVKRGSKWYASWFSD